MSEMTDAEREAAFLAYCRHHFRVEVPPEAGGRPVAPSARLDLHQGARANPDDDGTADAQADAYISRYITRGR